MKYFLLAGSLIVFSLPLSAQNSSNTTFMGRWLTAPFNDNSGWVAGSGSFVYVGFVDDHLQVLDVTDPTNPVEMRTFSNCGRPVVISDHLFCLSHKAVNRVEFTDITDSAYFSAHEYFDTGSADVAVNGNYAYMLAADRLVVVDVSDPAHTSVIGSHYFNGTLHSVAASGDYVYLGACFGGLIILDMRDPAHPSEVGGARVHGGSVTLRNRLAFVDGWIIDVNDPANPSKLGYFGSMSEVVASGNYAYSASGSAGMRIFNITSPAEPVEVGFLQTGDFSGTTDAAFALAVGGDLIYVLDRFDGLYIVRNDLVATAVENESDVPTTFSLSQNYPNPFNPATSINFDLPDATDVRLVVLDLLGRQVATVVDKPVAAGKHKVTWVADGVPSGVYLYRMEAEGFAEARRMVLLK